MDAWLLGSLALLAASCGGNGDDSAKDSPLPDTAPPVESPPFETDSPVETGDRRDSVAVDTGPFDQDGDGSPASEDCDDGDANTYPGAVDDYCDGVDHDCDGVVGVASADGEEYAAIQEALDAATTGGQVLICPGTHTESLTVRPGRGGSVESHSGDPTDTVLSGEGKQRILTIWDGASVELANLSFVNGFDDTEGGGSVYLYEADMVMRGCHVNDCVAERGCGGVRLEDRGTTPRTLEFESCLFENNQGQDGGAISVISDESDLTVQVGDSRFEGNEASSDGGSLYAFSHLGEMELTIENSVFESNATSEYYGGAVSVYSFNEAPTRLSASSFVGNVAAHGGGAFYQCSMSDGVLVVDGCDFQDNESLFSGGAIIMVVGTLGFLDVDVSESTFVGNTAEEDAGAFSVGASAGASVSINNTVFEGNAAASGGAVSVSGSTDVIFAMSDTLVEGNVSELHGAVYLGMRGELTGSLERVDVVDNVGTGMEGYSIGGMLVSTYASGRLDIVQGSVTGNSGYGIGGVYVASCDVALSSTAADWGEGATDNSPNDLEHCGWESGELGTNETFTCDATGCR